MKKVKTIRKVLLFAYMALILATNLTTPIYAANDPVTVVNNFSDFMFGTHSSDWNDSIGLWNCTGWFIFKKTMIQAKGLMDL